MTETQDIDSINRKMFVLLHGYGDSGEGMEPIKRSFADIAPKGSKFFCPNAPFSIPKERGYSWYPFVLEEDTEKLNEEFVFNGMQTTMPYLRKYIINNMNEYNFSFQDIVLIGFSQGAGLATHASLRLGSKICGTVSFSGGFANPYNDIENPYMQEVKSPICFIHGKKDRILPHMLSEQAYKSLHKAGFNVELYLFDDLKHKIDENCLNCAKKFLKKIINK